MSVLPQWAGEGSLPADVVNAVAEAERSGWAAMRSLQGEPFMDVIRYVSTGGDPARGVKPTRTLVPDLTDVPIVWNHLTKDQAEKRGVVYVEGIIWVETYTDVRVVLTDLIRVAGTVYDVTSAHFDEHFGRGEVFATVRPGGDLT